MESNRQKRDFFQFRVSVFIEKKLEDKTSQSWSYLKSTSYMFFSLPISINQRGIVLNIKRNALISILQQKLLLEALQVIIRLQISIWRKGNYHHVLFCWKGLTQAEKVNRKLNCVCKKRLMIYLLFLFDHYCWLVLWS